MSADLRGDMESRFGTDLGDVRLHTDASAATAARSLGALAFTAGSDIYFAEGRYDPSSSVGAKLLAHELTHTRQGRDEYDIHRQMDAGVSDAGVASAASAAGGSTRAVIDALNAPQEYGVGDYDAAVTALEAIPEPARLDALRELDRGGYLDILAANEPAMRRLATDDAALLTMVIAVREERLSHVPTHDERVAAQVQEVNVARRNVYDAFDRIQSLRERMTSHPEQFALVDAQSLRPAHRIGVSYLQRLKANLLPENAIQAAEIDGMIANFETLNADIDAAVNAVNAFQMAHVPEITAGELYEDYAREQRGYAQQNWAGGYYGYWALNQAELFATYFWEGAGGVTTLGYMPLEARNAAIYRAGQISYEAYELNVVYNVIHALVVAAVTVLTFGFGAELAIGEGVLGTAAAEAVSGGAVSGVAGAVASDIYDAAVANISSVPGVQAYHESGIVGPGGWIQAGVEGGLLGGIFAGIGIAMRGRQGPVFLGPIPPYEETAIVRRGPSALAPAEETSLATTGESSLARSGESSLSPTGEALPTVAGEAGLGETIPPGARMAAFEFRIIGTNPATGEVLAIGRSTITGEIAVVRVNPATGDGTAMLIGTSEVLPIRGGHIAEPLPALAPGEPTAGTGSTGAGLGPGGGGALPAGQQPLPTVLQLQPYELRSGAVYIRNRLQNPPAMDPARTARMQESIEAYRRNPRVPRRIDIQGQPGVEGGTVAVAETDIPALSGRRFPGASAEAMPPEVRGSASAQGGTVLEPVNPTAVDHAEHVALEQLRRALQQALDNGTLTRSNLQGRTVYVLVEQEPCSSCASGAGGGPPGVLQQFSQIFPELTLEVRNMRTMRSYIYRGGELLNP